MLVGDNETAACNPVPVSESLALTVPKRLNEAERLPDAEGVKTRLTVQDELAAMVPALTHVPVPALVKSLGLVPVIVK